MRGLPSHPIPVVLRRFVALALLALFVGAPASAAPSLESLFQVPAFDNAQLSPDGRRVAFLVSSKDGPRRLGVLDLQTMKATPVAEFDAADVAQFRWVSDERLVFDGDDTRFARGGREYAPGLFAVNADGSKFRQLVHTRDPFVRSGNAPELLPWNTFLLRGAQPARAVDAFVVKHQTISLKEDDHLQLQRVNTFTGLATDFDTPAHAVHWVLDAGGELRAVVTRHEGREAVHLKLRGGGWKRLEEGDAEQHEVGHPVHVAPDGRLIVQAHRGLDTLALHAYDPEGRLADKPLLAVRGYDIEPQFIQTDDALLGVRLLADAEVTHWFDDGMKALQAEIDERLPQTINSLAVAGHARTPYVLVKSFSDRQPPVYFVYDRTARKLSKLGASRPGLDAREMGHTDFVRYKARDGLEIPAYLTLPPGVRTEDAKRLPMVVLVHGGPFVRGHDWAWDPEVQFLATRGYAVLQPEFRGSRGFGHRHFKAGWKQWGLAMQDDLADGVQWAVERGVADRERVCIAGASYAGYATLMGLVRHPQLYRCGVQWVGVSDIELMYTARWSDLKDEDKRFELPKVVGDLKADAEQLKATSPLHQAGRIRQPLLMAYGRQDYRVPLVHGEKLRDALKPHNPQVEWVVYDEEGHGWRRTATHIDFWRRVERFLQQHLQPLPAAAAASPSGG